MLKVIHEKNNCIGCGACVSICPKYWEMGDDGKSTLKNSVNNEEKYELEVESISCNQDAADSCPVHCIIIIKE